MPPCTPNLTNYRNHEQRPATHGELVRVNGCLRYQRIRQTLAAGTVERQIYCDVTACDLQNLIDEYTQLFPRGTQTEREFSC